MHTLIRSAGILLSNVLGTKELKYTVTKAVVQAPQLAQTGQQISIKTELLFSLDIFFIFKCIAYQDDGSICGILRLHLNCKSNKSEDKFALDQTC